jgi:hypothetical protein
MNAAVPTGRPVSSAFLNASSTDASASPSTSPLKSSMRLKDRRHRHQAVVRADEVGADARPAPVLRPRHQPRANGVHSHIAHGRQEVGLVHRDRSEATVEQMTAPASARIDEVRPSTMCRSERAGQAVLSVGNEDQMDVIGHQALSPDLDGRLAHLLGEDVTIDVLIPLFKKISARDDCLAR